MEKVNIKDKFLLTPSEASEYFNIGLNRMGKLLRDPGCPFVVRVGAKKMVKRGAMEKWLENRHDIP